MGNGMVLVVDDEAQIRTTVKMVVTQAGDDVAEAVDGDKAIQAIKCDDTPLMVDMLLCDMQMPKLGGLGVIDYFRGQFPSVPIVVMTAYADIKDATQLMKQGIVDYLVKPVEKSKLVDV